MSRTRSEKSPKELSKKHQSKIEKEKRQNRILIGGISAVFIIVIGLVVYAFLSKSVLKNNQPVAKVGNTVITTSQFENRVRFERYQDINTFEQYATSYLAGFFQSQLLDIQNRLDNTAQFGSDTLDTMISQAAMIQKARSMGINVSDAEVEAEIQANFNYYPSGTPTTSAPTATITFYPTSTLSAIQKTLTFETATPTPKVTNTPVESATPTIDLSLTPVPTDQSGAAPSPTVENNQPTKTATLSPSPAATETTTPTPTEYTAAGYKSIYSTVVAGFNTSTNFSEQELREYFRAILYERKVNEKISATVPLEQDMVWARQILVPDQTTADQVEKDLKSGVDWSTLVTKYSTDTNSNTNNGDVGWFAKGVMVKPFEDAAWSMDIGAISAPVKSDYGYHIIQVLGHEKRQLSADELTAAQKAAFQAFVDAAKTEYGVKKYDNWTLVIPSEPVIPAQDRISANATPVP
jgi:parvulin-like peptidyl-prolyl isomerase